MTVSNFNVSLSATLAEEGGFVDDPRDPGGRTNHGVTQVTYNTYRRNHRLPNRDVRLIAPSEVSDIYKYLYWAKAGCDALPSGVDLVVFDYSVNSGVGRAVPEAAKHNHLPADLAVKMICQDRLRFLQGLRTWHTFGRGWSARVSRIEAKALTLINKK